MAIKIRAVEARIAKRQDHISNEPNIMRHDRSVLTPAQHAAIVAAINAEVATETTLLNAQISAGA